MLICQPRSDNINSLKMFSWRLATRKALLIDDSFGFFVRSLCIYFLRHPSFVTGRRTKQSVGGRARSVPPPPTSADALAWYVLHHTHSMVCKGDTDNFGFVPHDKQTITATAMRYHFRIPLSLCHIDHTECGWLACP